MLVVRRLVVVIRSPFLLEMALCAPPASLLCSKSCNENIPLDEPQRVHIVYAIAFLATIASIYFSTMHADRFETYPLCVC